MKKLFLAIFCLWAATARAQTVTYTLQWDHVGDILSNVNTYTFGLKIDAATAIAISPTCATNGLNVTCTTPVSLISGNHTITVTASNANGTASGTLNYVPPVAPINPSNIKVIVKITVP